MSMITRETRETKIRVELSDDPSAEIATTVPFLDHMLGTLARYGNFGLKVTATGDLKHHIIEDVAIAVGLAVRDRFSGPIARFGFQVIPMDDAVVECALDLGGRPFYRGPLPSSLYDHWMRSFADNAGATLHLFVRRGKDRHHVVEAAFKALGRSLRQATRPAEQVESTKGDVRVGR